MRRFMARAMGKVRRMNEEQLKLLLEAAVDEADSLEAALDSMLDGIVVCDGRNCPIIWNKAAERLLRLAYPEGLERPLWRLVENEAIASFLKEKIELEESVFDREFDTELGNEARLLSVSLSPLVKDRKIQGSIVHVEDITQKRKEEARLRRAESLASLTTLAAGVAHEIKNPLGALSIHVQLIRRTLKAKGCVEPQELEPRLNVVEEEIERLNRIVVDFLFAVRPMDVRLMEGELAKVVAEVAELVGPEAEAQGVSVKTALPTDLPFILLDGRYMKQAFLNLAKNALAAMPEGGELRFGAELKGDEIVVAVSDNGVGIPEDSLGKIFEPYYTTRESGTGLGLTLTYKIVKEHGGDISVKSRLGEGTTIVISLPVPQKERRLLTSRADEIVARS